MINYEIEDSPFFEENKNYLESFMNNCSDYNPESSGNCNSFGFDVEIKFSKNQEQYVLNLKKKQSTQNGILIPVNAGNNFENKIGVINFPSDKKVTVSKSSLKRFLMSNKLKDRFPAPYFVELSEENIADDLSALITKFDIDELEITNRKLKLKTFKKIENLDVIDEIVKTLTTG